MFHFQQNSIKVNFATVEQENDDGSSFLSGVIAKEFRLLTQNIN